KAAADRLGKTRPTGQDLFFAVDWMTSAASRGEDLVEVAERYAQQNIEQCRKIGENGAGLIRNGARILTHCNAGALAAVDYGTATAPMRVAQEKGRRFFVYVDEPRPGIRGQDPDRRTIAAGGPPSRRSTDRAEGKPGPQPIFRRHAGQVHHRDHHGAGNPEAVPTPPLPTRRSEEKSARQVSVGGYAF